MRSQQRAWRTGPLVALATMLAAAGCGVPMDPTPASVAPPAEPPPTPTTSLPTQASPSGPPTPSPVPTATLSLGGGGEAADPLFAIEVAQFTTPALDWAEMLGAGWIRHNGVLWSVAEPDEGERRWAALTGLEEALALAEARGIEPILIVRGTPAWAQAVPGWHCGPILPEKLGAFADFMHDLVARYSGAPYHVKYWELGNEPDVAPQWVPAASPFGCWGEPDDAYFGGGAYADMLRTVYPAIKAAGPDAQVIVGGLLLDCDPRNPPSGADCTPARYLEGILLAGGGDYFDGVAFHAYDYYGGAPGQYSNSGWHSAWNTTGPVLVAKARYLRELLARYGHPEKMLLNTETALLCGSSGAEPMCRSAEFAETKASYLVQSYAAAATEGLSVNVWYSLTGWRASGLIDQSKQPEPAFRAFQFVSERLAGAAAMGSVEGLSGLAGYRFGFRESELWILWSQDGETHAVGPALGIQAAYDLYGDPITFDAEVEVGRSPVYLLGSD